MNGIVIEKPLAFLDKYNNVYYHNKKLTRCDGDDLFLRHGQNNKNLSIKIGDMTMNGAFFSILFVKVRKHACKVIQNWWRRNDRVQAVKIRKRSIRNEAANTIRRAWYQHISRDLPPLGSRYLKCKNHFKMQKLP